MVTEEGAEVSSATASAGPDRQGSRNLLSNSTESKSSRLGHLSHLGLPGNINAREAGSKKGVRSTNAGGGRLLSASLFHGGSAKPASCSCAAAVASSARLRAASVDSLRHDARMTLAQD